MTIGLCSLYYIDILDTNITTRSVYSVIFPSEMVCNSCDFYLDSYEWVKNFNSGNNGTLMVQIETVPVSAYGANSHDYQVSRKRLDDDNLIMVFTSGAPGASDVDRTQWSYSCLIDADIIVHF